MRRYERIEGWRITLHELGPHQQAESCDEVPVCRHVYRSLPAAHRPWFARLRAGFSRRRDGAHSGRTVEP